MEYRLICILNSKTEDIEIEICLETGSKSLSPFQRKVNGRSIRMSNMFASDVLAQLLFKTGQEEQPFSFSKDQLLNADLLNALQNCKWVYERQGGKRTSLKKLKDFPASFNNNLSLLNISNRLGVLIGGEIYIKELKSWWKNMDIRFRYENCNRLLPIGFTSVPILDSDNHFFYRDRDNESLLIEPVDYFTDSLYSTLSLEKPDVSFLKIISSKGWKVFIPTAKKDYKQALYHKDASGIEWFGSEEKIGEDNNNIEDILNAYLNGRNFIESDGNIKVFDSDNIRHLPTDKFVSNLTLNIETNVFANDLTPLSDDEISNVKFRVSKNVKAELKPYQMEGVLWLEKLKKNRCGGLLADDMGLGKTLQTLAFLSLSNGTEKFLVVCPASLIQNWKNEILKFVPHLIGRFDIQSYESIRIHVDEYRSKKYNVIIVDEGQMVKNDDTFRHKAIESIDRNMLIILSGTPIENSLDEIWALFKLIIPETKFIYNKLNDLINSSDRLKMVEISKRLLYPFILRRTKEEVLNLPKMEIKNVFLELSDEERDVYSNVRKAFLLAMSNGISGRVNSIALEGLLRLRQCCVNINLIPRSLNGKLNIKSSKFKKAIDMMKDLTTDNHKVLLFSQFPSAMKLLMENDEVRKLNPLILTGETKNRQEIVNRFQNDNSALVLMISIKAGGTGLNLTAADRIILLDDWWNPAVENQAFARAHRIGQNKEVKVFRLVCKDTVEEKILVLHNNKMEISNLFNSINNKLTIDEIKQLFD